MALSQETQATLATMDQTRQQQIAEITATIEQQRRERLAAARGQAISRGMSGSSFEQRAASEVNRLADEALRANISQINAQYETQRLQLVNDDAVREWQSLEQEKQNAFAAGENDKARAAEERQAELARQEAENNARIESQQALIGNATTLGAAYLMKPAAVAPAAAGTTAAAGAPASAGMFSSALNRTGQSLFSTGANPAAGASGPALPTFSQGIFRPYSTGVAPGGAGAAGQALGTAASIYGGARLGQTVSDSMFGQRYNQDRAISRGGKAGSAVGAAIGSYFGGPYGAAAGGAIGGLAGANTGEGLRMIANTGAGASDNKGITISNLAEGMARKPLQGIAGTMFGGAGVKAADKVTKAWKKAFCFLPSTPIEVPGDKTVPIGKLELGDETLGGTVVSIRRSISDDLFVYGGIYVTGSHAIREDGLWIRVADSLRSEKVEGAFEVVSIVTTKHRVYSMGLCMADEMETEEDLLDFDDSLRELNRQEVMRGA
jgi:hypothetical protein